MIWDTHGIKIHFVEATISIGLLDRSNIDTLGPHIEEEHREATVFRDVRVSSRDENTVVTVMSA